MRTSRVESQHVENRSGILRWQETCLAKGQMKWGLERLLGPAESCDGGGGGNALGEQAADGRRGVGLCPGVMGSPPAVCGVRTDVGSLTWARWYGAGPEAGRPGGCRNHDPLPTWPASCSRVQKVHTSLLPALPSTPSNQ